MTGGGGMSSSGGGGVRAPCRLVVCRRGRGARGSGYHEPAGRVSAAATRRRGLVLFIRTELGASDGALRVPARHRGPAAARARAQGREAVRTRPCVPRARQAAAPPRGTRRHRPRAAGPGVSRPDLVKRGSRRRPAGSEVGGRHPPVSEPGEGPDLPGDRCRAAVPGRWSGTPLGRPHAAPAPGVRGDRHGGPQVPDEEGEDDPPRPRPRHPGTPPPSSPGT